MPLNVQKAQISCMWTYGSNFSCASHHPHDSPEFRRSREERLSLTVGLPGQSYGYCQACAREHLGVEPPSLTKEELDEMEKVYVEYVKGSDGWRVAEAWQQRRWFEKGWMNPEEKLAYALVRIAALETPRT